MTPYPTKPQPSAFRVARNGGRAPGPRITSSSRNRSGARLCEQEGALFRETAARQMAMPDKAVPLGPEDPGHGLHLCDRRVALIGYPHTQRYALTEPARERHGERGRPVVSWYQDVH